MLPPTLGDAPQVPPDGAPVYPLPNQDFYLPFISASGKPGGASETVNANTFEAAVFRLLRDDPRQGRSQMIWHPALAAAARAKALDMGRRRYISHVTPDGEGPHILVRRAGFPLPATYPNDTSNYIESLAAGQGSPQAVIDDWCRSPTHRAHVLGEAVFNANQHFVGVGYAWVDNNRYAYWAHFWVFFSAEIDANGTSYNIPIGT